MVSRSGKYALAGAGNGVWFSSDMPELSQAARLTARFQHIPHKTGCEHQAHKAERQYQDISNNGVGICKSAPWQRLSGGQVPGRVNRFALAADFKVQLDAVRVAVAHLGDLLAFFDSLVFLD